MTVLPLAHTGHVIVDLVTFAPVLALVIWFVVVVIRDRHRRADE
jgi:hypothetical protein